MDAMVKKVNGAHELRYERHLKHPVAKVWAAQTQPERFAEWLAEREGDLVPVGSVRLRWLNMDDQGNTAVATGKVTVVDPPRVLEFDTDIHGRLIFTCLCAYPEEYVSKCLAGWHIHLEHLEAALNGQPVNWPRWTEEHFDRWSEHNDRYAAKLKAGH